MRRPGLGHLAIALLAAALTVATAAAAGQTARMTFGDLTIEGQSCQGSFRERGPWEWEGPVTVRASGLTMTCDRFKVWPTPDYRDFERVEAAGDVHIEGRYLTAEETEWEIDGRADAGEYDAKTQQGILTGAVTFRARNTATGAILSAAAERLIYDAKTRGLRFERGDEPVQMEWQAPEPPAEPSGESPDQPEAEKADGG
jgi:lipopolysaccharide export system protein LptA